MLKRKSVIAISTLVALLLGAAMCGRKGVLADDPATVQLPPTPPMEVRYTLEVRGGGEIFPALASSSPAQYWPVATLTVVNDSSRPLVETVSAEILEWSRRCVQTFTLRPNETRTLALNPELLPPAFANGEIRLATLAVQAGLQGAAPTYEETRPVYLHAASDMFWGNNLVNAQFIARWVTPHDPAVLRLVSSARHYVRRGRLAGYKLPGASGQSVAAQVEDEAQAVFTAMQKLGLSYVDSILTFGRFTAQSERVRLPGETLSLNGANCIDLSVAFASAMENLGMEPVIVLVPGHAFTGVRRAPGSREILYLDLTVMPDGTFDAALRRAQNWLLRTPKSRVNLIDIVGARARQIYPMPASTPASPVRIFAAAHDVQPAP